MDIGANDSSDTRRFEPQPPRTSQDVVPASLRARVPGLALATAIAAVATVIGKILLPVVGAPLAAIVLGITLAAVLRPGVRFQPGISTASKLVLQVSVVVLGSQLSLTQIMRVGLGSLPVMIGSLTACLVAAYWVGRWLGIVGNLRTLIAVGTGICGASAIAAVTPLIGAASADVAYAVSTIFLFNLAAVVIFPILGHTLNLSQHSFGLFAGTAVNDMSSVVATSTLYGTTAINYAIVVKLTRTLLIIPVCLGLAALIRWESRTLPVPTEGAIASAVPARSPLRVRRLVPWFLIGFLLMALANSATLIPSGAHQGLVELSAFLITIALSAIGLSTDVRGLRRAGTRPLVLGAVLWVTVSAVSLMLQFVTGSL